MRENGVTVAALVMFGRQTSLEQYLPQTETIFEYRNNKNSIHYDDRKNYRYGFMGYYELISDIIQDKTGVIPFKDGLY
ncbi:MAG: hypothetical protein KAH30_05250 [Caldisericia bacterium]|nr:hypothetical protein [Caldisericia bacterium]